MNFWRFTGIFVAISLAIPVVLGLLEKFTGIVIPRAGMVAIPTIMATMTEGQLFGRATRRLPEKAEIRAFAGTSTAISVAVSLVFIALAFVGMQPDAPSLFLGIMAGLLALFALLAYFGGGWFFKIGARNEIRRLDKLDALK